MTKQPCIRKSVKWGGTAAALAACMLAAASEVTVVRVWLHDNLLMVAHEGALRTVHGGDFPVMRHVLADSRFAPGIDRWVPTYRRFEDSDVRKVTVPLWPLAAALAWLTVVAWRSDAAVRRRDRMHCCMRCGYSLVGLSVDAVCPECGRAAVG